MEFHNTHSIQRNESLSLKAIVWRLKIAAAAGRLEQFDTVVAHYTYDDAGAYVKLPIT